MKGWRLVHSLAGEESNDEEITDEEEDKQERWQRGQVEEVVSVSLVPGEGWDQGVATDEDSDGMEEPVARGARLPRVLQAGEASLATRRMTDDGARVRAELGEEEEEGDDDTQEDSQEQEEDGPEDWELGNSTLLGVNIPVYEAPQWSYEQQVQMEACETSLDWYEIFSSREWMQKVQDQALKYAIYSGRNAQLPHITIDNIR